MVNVTVVILFADDQRVTQWQADRFEPNRVNRTFRDYVNDTWHVEKPLKGAIVISNGDVYQYTANEVAELAGEAK